MLPGENKGHGHAGCVLAAEGYVDAGIDQDQNLRVEGSVFGVLGSGFGLQGLGLRVQGLGFSVRSLGFRIQGFGLGVKDSEFGV